MNRGKLNQIAILILFALFTWTSFAAAQTHMQYQDRGNRYEGIKSRPVSGYNIELISARVDYKEKTEQVPKRFKVKFYLEKASKVYLTVRELDYKHYYWMDKVQLSKVWAQGFDNTFEWPTEVVIQRLDEINMYSLGVVARLKNPKPGMVEQVAPVILYHSHVPSTIEGYLFTFKTNAEARLTCSIYKAGETDPVFTSTFRRQRAGRPFTVRWNSSLAQEGPYQLLITGYLLKTNDSIDQTVRFFHQPVVK